MFFALKGFIGGFGDATSAFEDGEFARAMRRAANTDHLAKGWENAGDQLRRAASEVRSEQAKQKAEARRQAHGGRAGAAGPGVR
ncbi:MAG: hypothetical protein AB1651_13065 [Pseudomonadota bacterium]